MECQKSFHKGFNLKEEIQTHVLQRNTKGPSKMKESKNVLKNTQACKHLNNLK